MGNDGVWHTLDGRRIEGQPTQKGVYIVNGRKVVIK
jgi:alpha-amylase